MTSTLKLARWAMTLDPIFSALLLNNDEEGMSNPGIDDAIYSEHSPSITLNQHMVMRTLERCCKMSSTTDFILWFIFEMYYFYERG